MWHQLLQDIARQSAQQGTLPDPTPDLLCQIWPAMVGSSLARMSEPATLNGRQLTVKVRNQQLAREWKRSSLPLLKRVRRFCPWPIETLEIIHDPTAGVVDPAGSSGETDSVPPADADPGDDDDTSVAAGDDTDGIDDELQELITAISRARRRDD